METTDPVLRRIPPNQRAFVVLIAGVMAMMTFGTVYTFGNMLPYMVSYFRWKVDPDMTAGSMIWLQTLMSGLPLGMLLGGILEQKLGGRRSAIIGCILYTSGIASTYYTIQYSYYAVLLSMGIVASLGSSIAYNSFLPTAQRWFPDRVGMAGGAIIGGYGCGAFLLSPLQTAWINPLEYRPNAQGFFTQPDLLERVPFVFVLMASMFACFQLIGLVFLGQPEEVLLYIVVEEVPIESGSLWGDDETGPSRSSASSSTATLLRTSTFALLFASLTCNSCWTQLTSGLYKAYGQTFITSDFFLSFIGSMSAVFNAGSRFGWGTFADYSSYQLSMAIVCSLGAIMSSVLPAVKVIGSKYLYLGVICLMFSCVGGTFSLFPYVTHKCFGNTNFSVMYGFLQFSLSVAGVIAALLSQFVLPIVGYEVLFLVSGSFMAVSLLLTTMLNYTSVARANGQVQPQPEPRRQSWSEYSY